MMRKQRFADWALVGWSAVVVLLLLASVAPTTLLGGGVGFVFIALMAATSFDRTSALLGRRAWKVLHTVGMYYLWVVSV